VNDLTTPEGAREFGIANAVNAFKWKKKYMLAMMPLVQADEFSADFKIVRMETEEAYNGWMMYHDDCESWSAEATEAFKQEYKRLTGR